MLFYDFEVFAFDWLVVIMDTDQKKETVIVNDAEQLQAIYDAHINDIGHHKGNQQLKAGFQHFEQRGKDGFFLVSFQKPQHVPHERTNLFVISNYMPKATPHNSRLTA